MILVAVRDHDPTQLVDALGHVRHVGNDQIDAQHLLVGEHESGIDEHEVVAILQDHHVLADLAETAQRYDGQSLRLRVPPGSFRCRRSLPWSSLHAHRLLEKAHLLRGGLRYKRHLHHRRCAAR